MHLSPTRALLALSCTALVLCGCQKDPSGPHGDSGTEVTEVTLRNGVRCAVMDSPGSKTVRCNWKGPRAAATNIDPEGSKGTTIRLIKLSDGHECAVMDGPAGKALDCDW